MISGNNGLAVDINGINWDRAVPTVRSNNILVAGNYIGTNASGTAAVPNLSHGVVVHEGAFDVRVGSGLPNAGNVISGNNQVGVYVLTQRLAECVSKVIESEQMQQELLRYKI